MVSLVCVLPACAGADMGSPGAADPRGPGGDVATSQNELREDACWAAAPDRTIAVGGAHLAYDAKSPGGAYDHAGCPHSFVVDATNTLGRSVLVTGGARAIDTASEDWCEGFWSESEARGCSTTPCAWDYLGSWSERAKWRPATASSPGVCERAVTGLLPSSRARTVSRRSAS